MTVDSGGRDSVSGFRKGLSKIEIALKWDPSPTGTPANDLDIIAGVYSEADPNGQASYLVHFGSRSPDGTITLNRDSRTGQGLGFDEVMTLELTRLADRYTRVVVGVAIQPTGAEERPKSFRDIPHAHIRISEGYTELAEHDFSFVESSSSATVAEFTRNEHGAWTFRQAVRGFDAGPADFTRVMGSAHSR
ncbi:TerD family protein [Streptomyces sp. NPDC006879]|uniref:TerD family protein n=1 Tax=Streptomyces sp. NPDC006879 TaxID=3364767 RepID=UPI0036CE03EE